MVTWQFSDWFALAVLLTAVAVILLYDLAVYLRYGTSRTISHGVWILSLRYPLFRYALIATASFVVGFFACHFFGFG